MKPRQQKELANSGNDGIMDAEVRMDDLLNNPQRLREHTPEEWHEIFRENGNAPRPLGKGSLKGVEFGDGGGYRVNWNNNKVLIYHPEKRSHHGGEYFKLSSGTTTIRYDRNGIPLRGKEA